ncbi:MAG: indolepyruvate oxidoreductase subunit beta [Candidatus Cloacimonetes bacterium]|nr:indolepyruvate oxidoreductase subunit beta [Candidatus Cloacimonadota bacterium]
MKCDIILAGVGGQGILSISTIIGEAAVKKSLFLKQAEVHGMSQRGGEVQSHLRISDSYIFSDLIPKGKADMILSVEPLESLRYLPFLSPSGWLITSSNPFVNIPNYPDQTEIINEIKKIPNHIILDTDSIAKELGSPLVGNIVILGAASKFIPIDFVDLDIAIRTIFSSKGDQIVQLNLNALKAGRQAV